MAYNVDENTTPEKILAGARSETLRTLARNSVTCMAYDAIADMAVTANLMIRPDLKEKITEEPPPEFYENDAVIDDDYKQLFVVVAIQDPVDYLWRMETAESIQNCISNLVDHDAILKHSLRGQLQRVDCLPGFPPFELTISALARKEHQSDERKQQP